MSAIPLFEAPLAARLESTAHAVLGAVVNFAVLGVCAGIGAGEVGVGARSIPSGLLIGLGALVLTGPGLVVGHQFLGLEARPDALVDALAAGFVRCGKVALGMSPFALFFASTTSLWAAVLAAVMLGIAFVGFTWTASRLRAVEGAKLGSPRDLSMSALVLGWSVLTLLVALRLTWDVAVFVVG